MKVLARRFALVLLAGCASQAAADAPSVAAAGDGSARIVMNCGEGSRELPVPVAPATLTLVVHPANRGLRSEAPPGILVIQENGRDLEWSAASPSFTPIDARPPRLGMTALAVGDEQRIDLRTVPGKVSASVRVQWHCAPPDDIRQLPGCFERARKLLDDDAIGVDEQASVLCRALQTHAAATRASRRARPAESLALYRSARTLWAAVGDHVREAAAVLGAVEQVTRLGQFTQARTLAQEAQRLNRAAGNRYFATRARIEECVAMRNLGLAQPARKCLEPLPAELEKLGEWNDAANNYLNLAQFALDDGRFGVLRDALGHAGKIPQSAIAPFTSGRLSLLRASLAAGEGRNADAIAALSGALADFETAKDTRWQANAYLDLAELYRAMGATAEARIYADTALSLLDAAQAKARAASALWLRARLEHDSNDMRAALADLRAATALFESLEMTLAVYETRLDEQDWKDDVAAGELPPSPAGLPDRLRWHRDLSTATRAFRRGDFKAVDEFLASKPSDMTVDTSLAIELLQARRDAAANKVEKALSRLDACTDRVIALARQAGSPALRQMAARRLIGVRRAWIEVYLSAVPAARPPVESLWQAMARTQPRMLLVSPVRAAPDEKILDFDRALARELMPGKTDAGAASLATQRALLPIWSRLSPEDKARSSAPTLDDIRAGLPRETLVLVPLIGERKAAVLAMTPDDVTLTPAADAASLLQASADLVQLVAARTSPVDAITTAGAEAGRSLLPPGGKAPGRLLVVEDPSLSGLPYAALVWPGADGPLLATTQISVVTFPVWRKSAEPPAETQVFVAAPQAGQSLLPALGFAQREGELVQAAMPQHRVAIFSNPALSAESLLAAVEKPRTWVHVAAHGQTRAGLQGYSGLWLPSVREGEPDRFVSWLSLAGRHLEADLLVLNACETAETQLAPVGVATSFAEAMSVSGVQDVVAARWALSDAASRVWLPPFYAGMERSGTGAASSSLRDAQLALRRSLHFRHPFYWASLTHFSRGIPKE